MAFEADDRLAVLRVVSSGFWSVRQIATYFQNYNACIARWHGRQMNVTAICDLREAATQSQEVTDLLSRSISGIYKPGDRVAMIVANSLVKMQMRRVLDGQYHEFFLSLPAGEQWALAHKARSDDSTKRLMLS